MLSAVGGDAPYRNEKSANLAPCLRVGFVLFRSLAIRGAVSPGHRGCDTPGCQKARSAIRCIKTPSGADEGARGSVLSESTERHKVH